MICTPSLGLNQEGVHIFENNTQQRHVLTTLYFLFRQRALYTLQQKSVLSSGSLQTKDVFLAHVPMPAFLHLLALPLIHLPLLTALGVWLYHQYY